MKALWKKFAKWMVRLIDGIPISLLFIIVCVSIFAFAALYWIAGIILNQGPTASYGPASFWDCVYFSVVTFTSLGYGDIVPHGISKVIASIEVIVGLAYLGIFISKLSSAKLSFQVAQLYARDAQERLQEYALTLVEHRRLCQESLDFIKRGEQLPRALNSVQLDVLASILRIRAYLVFEIANGDFLLETPMGASTRLLKRLAQLVSTLEKLSCHQDSLHSQKQRSIAVQTITKIESIGTMMLNNSDDPGIESEGEELLIACGKAKAAIHAKVVAVSAKFGKGISTIS